MKQILFASLIAYFAVLSTSYGSCFKEDDPTINHLSSSYNLTDELKYNAQTITRIAEIRALKTVIVELIELTKKPPATFISKGHATLNRYMKLLNHLNLREKEDIAEEWNRTPIISNDFLIGQLNYFYRLLNIDFKSSSPISSPTEMKRFMADMESECTEQTKMLLSMHPEEQLFHYRSYDRSPSDDIYPMHQSFR
ncbi:MAG: hypothetical protein ACTHJ4_05010, partial [Candidatus Nucleicultricaceae bacterium]